MRKVLIFVLMLFASSFAFSAVDVSLVGKVSVAESGSMPSGLFARAVGYLPGDRLNVTNPANGSSVNVLVLGILNPLDDVLLLLSPEAAEHLGITGSELLGVNLSRRGGDLETASVGNAVLTEYNAEKAAASKSALADSGASGLIETLPTPKSNEPVTVVPVEDTSLENDPSLATGSTKQPVVLVPSEEKIPEDEYLPPVEEELPPDFTETTDTKTLQKILLVPSTSDPVSYPPPSSDTSAESTSGVSSYAPSSTPTTTTPRYYYVPATPAEETVMEEPLVEEENVYADYEEPEVEEETPEFDEEPAEEVEEETPVFEEDGATPAEAKPYAPVTEKTPSEEEEVEEEDASSGNVPPAHDKAAEPSADSEEEVEEETPE
ncbi:MAG: hypothetical protein II921_05920, partial [Treponema sp.]|nr:hypothetical protein [Treponema sp.]